VSVEKYRNLSWRRVERLFDKKPINSFPDSKDQVSVEKMNSS
jgi:hypothetical protein